MPELKIQILVDNPNSWIVPYAKELEQQIKQRGHKVGLIHKHSEVSEGDILCLLACEEIFKKLRLNKHNLVVHESDLPKGKGWSPLTWQILEGKNHIPITLFEAAESVDAGPIYAQEWLKLMGTELLPELKDKQGKHTIQLILDFIDRFPEVEGKKQEGQSSFYPKRTPKDSELDPNLSIAEQFNLLRVCDNERYPAFFKLNGRTYELKIQEKHESN